MNTGDCDLCGKPLAPNEGQRCQNCWNLEAAIARNPKLARKVFDRWELKQRVIANPSVFLQILQFME